MLIQKPSLYFNQVYNSDIFSLDAFEDLITGTLELVGNDFLLVFQYDIKWWKGKVERSQIQLG